MQYKNIFKTIFFLLAFFTISLVGIAYNSVLEISAQNTIAGLPTYIDAKNGLANSSISFYIETPENKTIKINSIVDSLGNSRVKLNADLTEFSGDYRVSAILDNGLKSNVSTFKVFPGDLNTEKSFFTPSDSVMNTNETVVLTLFLRDSFNNPISGKYLRIVPDKSGLIYEDKAFSTDSEGKIVFPVSSNITLNSVISVFDIELDKFLDLSTSVSFFNEGDYLLSGMGNSSGPVSSLKFENLPSEINPLEYLSFTISAYDSLNQLVNGYKGKVRFSVLTSNADKVILPSDYGFVTADQGSHTFTLALLFKESGNFKIQVQDMADPLIKGELDINVSNSTDSIEGSLTIELDSPLSGTYNSNIQTISGKAQAGAKLNIFDNDILLTTIIADIDGNFSYVTNPLVNGNHSVFVSAIDNQDIEVDRSETVNFTVDTEAPQVLTEEINPLSPISAGSEFEYKIIVDKPLVKAQVILNSVVYDLKNVSENIYSAKLVAPIIPGTYSLGIELRDSLQNELIVSEKLSIVVEEALSTMEVVTNLKAEAFDRRVVLTWDNPLNLEEISFYRIYYGNSPENLVNAVDTFTSANTWYVPNLQNGLEYFFQAEAVGLNGDTSPALSNIVSATPVLNLIDTVSPDVLHGVAGSEILNELESDVSNTGTPLSLLLGSFLIIISLIHFRKDLMKLFFC